jgi:small subunit ribosomal protein S1
VLKKGDRVKAVVLAIEADHRRLSLGMKQLQPDVWDTFFQQHRVGDVVHGKVLRIAGFGAFVEVADGVEGLCHNSEATDHSGQPVKLEPGQEHDFKIIKMNEAEKKIGLSVRALAQDQERVRLDDYHKQAAAATMTIEEAMRGKGETH